MSRQVGIFYDRDIGAHASFGFHVDVSRKNVGFSSCGGQFGLDGCIGVKKKPMGRLDGGNSV
jgi:hypothetical protein